jgi:hypothetical protein
MNKPQLMDALRRTLFRQDYWILPAEPCHKSKIQNLKSKISSVLILEVFA